MNRIYLLLIFILLTIGSFNKLLGQFTDITDSIYNIVPVFGGTSSFSDFDNDGDLDIIYAGNYDWGFGTYLFNNTNGHFYQNTSSYIYGATSGTIEWCDYNSDGKLDFIITGFHDYDYKHMTKLYKNVNNKFEEDSENDLIETGAGYASWCDYDNDGDIDVVVQGAMEDGWATKFYKNDGNIFSEDFNNQIYLGRICKMTWFDYDNDGFSDLLVHETNPYSSLDADIKIYQNQNGIFQLKFSFFGHYISCTSIGDYDNDGDIDIVTFSPNQNDLGGILINNNGSFSEENIVYLDGLIGNCITLDYDNDNDLDIIITGTEVVNYSESLKKTYMYINKGNLNFEKIELDFVKIQQQNSISCGDINNDGFPDVFVTGTTEDYPNQNVVAKLYRNEKGNTKFNSYQIPTTPSNLSVEYKKDAAVFKWSRTGNNSYTYNFYVGSHPRTGNIVSPMADIETGLRKIVSYGNAFKDTAWHIRNIKPGKYYWSVQSIDNLYKGSPFAIEQEFIMPLTSEFNLKDTSCINHEIIIEYNGNASENATFQWDFGEANVISGSGKGPYIVEWKETGKKSISLQVFDDNLISESTVKTIFIQSLPSISNIYEDKVDITEEIIIDAGKGFDSYKWSTGDTTQVLNIDANDFHVGNVWFNVEVTDNHGCINSQDFVISIIDIGNSDILKVYPNPVEGEFTVQLLNKINEDFQISFYNINGELIFKEKYDKTQSKPMISLGPKKGVFIGKLESATLSKTFKIVVY